MGEYADVTIIVRNQIDAIEAFDAFCEAVDEDFGVAYGWTAQKMKEASEDGSISAVLECQVNFGTVDRVKAAAVAHKVDIIVSSGDAGEYGGETYYVRYGKESESMDYVGGEIKISQHDLRKFEDKGFEFSEIFEIIEAFNPEGFIPFSLSPDVLAHASKVDRFESTDGTSIAP